MANPFVPQTAELVPLPLTAEQLHGFSRKIGQRAYQVDGERFWGVPVPRRIPSSPRDVYHTVTSLDEGRIDLISYRWYATPELWHAIADANGLFFPDDEIPVGTVLRIPEYTTLVNLGYVR